MEAAVVAPVDAPRFEPAIVGEKDDDGVVLEPEGAEPLEHHPDPPVHARDRVQVLRPLLPRDRMVGVIGGRGDVLGRGDLRVLALADPLDPWLAPRLAVVDVVFHLGHVDLRVERLMRLQGRPVVGFKNGAFVDEVQVELPRPDRLPVDRLDVGGKVARVLEPVGERAHSGRQAERIVAMRAHRMGAGRGLVLPVMKAERLAAQTGAVANTCVYRTPAAANRSR